MPKFCTHTNINFYFTGLVDILDIHKVMVTLDRFLPPILLSKLKRYINSDDKLLRSNLSWNFFKSHLENIDFDKCSQAISEMLSESTPQEKHVHIFHIKNNNSIKSSIEPTIENTTQMLYKVLIYIYKRNIISSIIKFILLFPLIRQFETSDLINSKKGIFYTIYKRLTEIIFEIVLVNFNGSHYDNFLIVNGLVIILTKLNEKIRIFKKGAAINSIFISIKKNLQTLSNITKEKPVIKKQCKKREQRWLLHLYIKDIRNLVSPNLSLSALGNLFKLPVQKLCFPYNKATSVKILKKTTSLHPNDEDFWNDNFSSKKITLEERIHSQNIFVEHKFQNLYEYCAHYLVYDCLLLHHILLTLFGTYLEDKINIFLRRNFSQSNLSYQQLLLVEPSRQIKNNMAPLKIKNAFYNYFIKQGVTGGLCQAFVHGVVNKESTINEHFRYIERPNLDQHIWPNFHNCQPWRDSFNEHPSCLCTIDIRSLYPSAALKKLPVGKPFFYSRFIPEDFAKIKNNTLVTYDINGFCQNVRNIGDHRKDIFKQLNNKHYFLTEYYALEHYLKSIGPEFEVIRFQSGYTAFGQLYFTEYPIDGYLTLYCKNSKMFFIKLIQFHSAYRHGHLSTCYIKNTAEDECNVNKTEKVRCKILQLIQHFNEHFKLSNVDIRYVEISDCSFDGHKIPYKRLLYPRQFSYSHFLDNIYNGKLTGFLVVKDLEIKKSAQNPVFGFIVQRVEYSFKNLSPYTQNLITHLNNSQRVVSLNKCKSFMVISTEYLNFLREKFGFEKQPDIYHALFFQTNFYLEPYIARKLQQRKTLKDLIKQENDSSLRRELEIKAELIKLLLNSCYGFTLCNTTSEKFKLLENRKQCPPKKILTSKIRSCIRYNSKTFLVEFKKQVTHPFQTLLGQVGSYILFNSKIILLERLFFLLQHLSPVNSQLTYMDTDSAHFLLKHKLFIDNVDPNLQESFKKNFDNHFETGPNPSGIWVIENYFEVGQYIGEKSYKLSNESDSHFLTHMKGLNSHMQSTFARESIDIEKQKIIKFHIFTKSPDFQLCKSYMSKNIFGNYLPLKRYFVSSSGSLPLKL